MAIFFLLLQIEGRNRITFEKALEIETQTRGQSQQTLWYEERQWRLTASRFGEICKSGPARDMQKLCSSLFTYKDLCNVAICHGK